MRRLSVICLIGITLFLDCFSQKYCTKSFDSNIKTVRTNILDNQLLRPIIELGSDEQIVISFDELSHEIKYFNYTIVHCNADWTPSGLAEVEYIDGFTTGVIDENYQSLNTTVLYTNYRLVLPNDDLKLKKSGNYAVLIYEDVDRDNLKAVACFSIVEPRVAIDATVKGETEIEINKRYQQLEFTIDHSSMRVFNPLSEFNVIVRQNNRRDNQVMNLKPTYTSTFKQTFCNNPALIFEGGNEYRSVDFSSEYTYGNGIERIIFDGEYQHVVLIQDELRNDISYLYADDVNGKYLVHRQFSNDSDTEADYMWVHFTLSVEQPWLTGSVYLDGDFMGEQRPQNRMDYNAESNCYEKAVFLKQGGFNYQYLFRPKGEGRGSLLPIEGSFWQTKNEYQIFVYYRPQGERYDRLIGWKVIE